MFFVSKGYFVSRNCLREVHATLEREKRITLVHDPVRAGAALDWLIREECPAELRGIFDTRKVIEWHRIRDFQVVSLKLLAAELLRGCPPPVKRSKVEEAVEDGGQAVLSLLVTPLAELSASFAPSARGPRDSRRSKTHGGPDGAPDPADDLYLPGEITSEHLGFPKPARLYVSPNNPGAAKVAKLISRTMPGLELCDKPPRAGTSGETATHFLLYLAHETWVGEPGDRLAAEVRGVMRAHLPIVMLHENDMANGGCEFGRFFSTTPNDLIQDGLYKALAYAYYPGPFRPVSLYLLAHALGAQATAGGRMTRLRQKYVGEKAATPHLQHDLGGETSRGSCAIAPITSVQQPREKGLPWTRHARPVTRGLCQLFAALHSPEEPRSCLAAFQGRYHGCEVPKAHLSRSLSRFQRPGQERLRAGALEIAEIIQKTKRLC